MKILLDTSPLLNLNSGRGVGTYTRELLAALRQEVEKTDVEILTSETAGSKQSYDVIHYPFFDLFFHTLPLPGKQPVIVTIHDVIPLVFPEQYKPGIKGTLRFWMQKRSLSQVSAVITDSESSKRDIVKYLGVPNHDVYVVPLAASPLLEPVSEYLVRKNLESLDLPDTYLLYIGDINYNKNLPTLLLALTQLPEDVHLCVVSRSFTNTSIPEGQQLSRLIKENDLSSRVHVLNVPNGDFELLASVIAKARCLVQPSLYEGFGLPVLEAMQVGTIVVSTNGGSLPEVNGNVAIEVEPNIAGLTRGIEQALKLRGDERQSLIDAGRKWASQFTWGKTAQLTLEVYQKVYQEAQGSNL